MGQISLKAARINANLTQKEVAKMLGVDRSTMRVWEVGERKIPADQFMRLCEIYNMSPDFIFLPSNTTKS